MAGDQPGDDGGHEPAAAQVLGGDGGQEGDGEGDDRVHRGVGDTGPQVQGELSDRPAHDQGHQDGGGEAAHHPGHGHGTGRGGGDGGGQDHQGGGVVEQALALQDGDNALGHAQAPGYGDGHGVGGAQDGSHGHGPGQGEAGDHKGEHGADDGGGDGYQQDRQDRHGGQLAAEVNGGDAHGGGVEQGRQDPLEDDLRLDLDGGHDGQEAHDDPQAQEQQGRGHLDPVAELGGPGDRQQPRYGDNE